MYTLFGTVLKQMFKKAVKENTLREDGKDVEQKRMQQRVKHTTATYVRVRPADTGEAYEEEYDDIWPPRMSNSVRRYQELADVRMEVGRTQADVQSLADERR